MVVIVSGMASIKVHKLATALSLVLLMPCFGQAVDAPAKMPDTAKPEAAKLKEVEPANENPVTRPEPPAILGWKEWIWIVKPELVLLAKLDTGAKTSSVHATNIQSIEVDGKKWVKFTITDPGSETGLRLKYKAPVVRVAKIKNDTGGLNERYVVALTFHIGGRELNGEFNLNDRSRMVCGVLIGRNMLQELGAVDSSRENLMGKPRIPAKRKKVSK